VYFISFVSQNQSKNLKRKSSNLIIAFYSLQIVHYLVIQWVHKLYPCNVTVIGRFVLSDNTRKSSLICIIISIRFRPQFDQWPSGGKTRNAYISPLRWPKKLPNLHDLMEFRSDWWHSYYPIWWYGHTFRECYLRFTHNFCYYLKLYLATSHLAIDIINV